MTSKKIQRPDVLSFNRCVSPSNGVMTMQFNDDRWAAPVVVRKMSSRGVNIQDSTPEKKRSESNLQSYDCAFLDNDSSILVLGFSVDFSEIGVPSTANDADYRQWLRGFVADYRERDQFLTLGRRYAWNLANGRFLWRNARNANSISIFISALDEQGDVERNFEFYGDISQDVLPEDHEGINALGDYIAAGLRGDRPFTSITVSAIVSGSCGREVFPSQSLPGDGADKSKRLYSVEMNGVLHAGMHPQKIGNAIRTIDTWYQLDGQETGNENPDARGALLPIAAEPYGTVSTHGVAYRPKKNDFYSLIDRAAKHEALSPEDEHFIFAVLARGGVFSKKKD